MKAKIDADTCIGCGLCANLCPEVFEMQGDKAIARPGGVPKEVEESCEQAASDCPVNAIEIL